MENDKETVDGYAVMVDPMDLLQCDSCQRAERPRHFGEARVHRR